MTKTKPILLLGEAYGSNEAKLDVGFVGAAGVELLRMLDDAVVIELTSEDLSFISKFWNTGDPSCVDAVWRLHPDLYRTNVFKFHPYANDITSLCGSKIEGIRDYPPLAKSKFLRREYIPHLEALADEIASVDPNLIVCLGNTPLWALAGKTGISKLRGTTMLSSHTISGYKLLPTYHPAAVLRQWELRPTTVIDLMKAERERHTAELKKFNYSIWTEPTLDDLETFYNQYIAHCALLSVDIETAGNQVTCIGFAPSPTVSLVVPFLDKRKKNKSYWPTIQDEIKAWNFVRRVCESPIPKVGQNITYDVAFMWRSVGICIKNIQEDAMLCHHALQPESLKGLGYLGSVYTDWPSWKGMRTETIKQDA